MFALSHIAAHSVRHFSTESPGAFASCPLFTLLNNRSAFGGSRRVGIEIKQHCLRATEMGLKDFSGKSQSKYKLGVQIHLNPYYYKSGTVRLKSLSNLGRDGPSLFLISIASSPKIFCGAQNKLFLWESHWAKSLWRQISLSLFHRRIIGESLKKTINIYPLVNIYMCMFVCICRSQRKLAKSWYFPPTLVPGIQLRSLDLTARAFVHWVISLARAIDS